MAIAFAAQLIAGIFADFLSPSAAPGLRHAPAADTSRGDLLIVITDSAGEAIRDAELVLDGVTFTFHRTIKTNRRGQGSFKNIPAETYFITARRVGYTAERREVTVTGGERATVAITLARFVQRLPNVRTGKETGIIAGAVIPFAAKVFYSAQVFLLDARGAIKYRAHSWADGKYRAADFRFVVDPGKYTLMARSMGFKTSVINDIIVEAGETEEVRLVLAYTGQLMPDSNTPQRFRNKKLYVSADELKKGPAQDIFCLIDRHSVGEPVLTGRACQHPRKLFINGERVPLDGDARCTAAEGIPGRIPPEDVQEIRFVSCWDESVPFDQRNSFWLNVKPQPPKQKKRK